MKNTSLAKMATAIALALSSLAAPAGDPLPKDWRVDRSLFPKAYGVLASERLMYPLDMRLWPVRIDKTRQLFVDNYLISRMENLRRRIHSPRRHPSNPVLISTRPDKAFSIHMPSVWRDPTTGTFRAWYSGWMSNYALPSGVKVRFPLLYATSEDGLTWKTPNLGLFEWKGSKANNIVIPTGSLAGVIIKPDDPDPAQRYKALVWQERPYVPHEAMYLYVSPDGIHWKRAQRRPIFAAPDKRGYTMPQPSIGDTSLFHWDRKLGRYVAYTKFVLPPKMRCSGMMESDDLLYWSRPRMVLYPDALDEPDTQIYGHRGFCYESLWMGFLRAMHTRRKGYKQVSVELTSSRDGRHWMRVGDRREFMSVSGSADDWDGDYHNTSSEPILVGDKLWIFYESCVRRQNDRKKGDRQALGLAILRRDGFVSLSAGETIGTVRTRPLRFEGSQLHVNAEIADGGFVRVGFISGENDKPLKGLTAGDCRPITAGGVDLPVSWPRGSNISRLAQSHARLEFRLRKAKLYSFWIE